MHIGQGLDLLAQDGRNGLVYVGRDGVRQKFLCTLHQEGLSQGA